MCWHVKSSLSATQDYSCSAEAPQDDDGPAFQCRHGNNFCERNMAYPENVCTAKSVNHVRAFLSLTKSPCCPRILGGYNHGV
jgi:hypothetical protein